MIFECVTIGRYTHVLKNKTRTFNLSAADVILSESGKVGKFSDLDANNYTYGDHRKILASTDKSLGLPIIEFKPGMSLETADIEIEFVTLAKNWCDYDYDENNENEIYHRLNMIRAKTNEKTNKVIWKQ